MKLRLDGWRFRWDVVLFFAFLLAAMRHWTELAVHELLGVAVAPILAVHLWLNWSWIVDVLGRSGSTLRREVRFNRAWDIAQCVVALVAFGSGLVVSQHVLPAIGFTPPRNRLVEDVHAVSAWILMVMIGIHLGVHGHWIWSKMRKPRFALMFVLVPLVISGIAQLEVLRRNEVFARRFRGDAIKVTSAVVPAALISFGILVVARRRRAA